MLAQAHEAKNIFAKRVQPILLAHYRSPGMSQSEPIDEISAIDGVQRDVTQATLRNMHAVLMQIDRDRPKQVAPLLKRRTCTGNDAAADSR